MEPTYCIYYVKIILGLTDKSNIQEFINQLKKTYKETIIQLFKDNNKEAMQPIR